MQKIHPRRFASRRNLLSSMPDEASRRKNCQKLLYGQAVPLQRVREKILSHARHGLAQVIAFDVSGLRACSFYSAWREQQTDSRDRWHTSRQCKNMENEVRGMIKIRTKKKDRANLRPLEQIVMSHPYSVIYKYNQKEFPAGIKMMTYGSRWIGILHVVCINCAT